MLEHTPFISILEVQSLSALGCSECITWFRKTYSAALLIVDFGEACHLGGQFRCDQNKV